MRVELRQVIYPFRCVTTHANRNSAHDSEGESNGGLGTVAHRMNYTIFGSGRVVFRGSEWFAVVRTRFSFTAICSYHSR